MANKITQILGGESGRLLLMAFVHGLAFSLVIPIMSYFIVDGLGKPPYFVGIYTIGIGLTSIIASQTIGKLIDRGANNKTYLTVTIFSFAIAAFTFAISDNFLVIMITGMTFMAIGNSAISLMLSLGRKYSMSRKLDAGLFNSVLRAQISVAWILGAPIAFWLVAHFGFSATFVTTGVICILWLTLAYWLVPDVDQSTIKLKSTPQSGPVGSNILFISGALFFANMANTIYVTSMPLYVILELKLPEQIPGWLLAIAAAIEIPIMIVVSQWTRYIKSRYLLYFGLASGVLFYAGMYWSTTVWVLIMLQICNGIFYGIFAGLGITIIQDLLPERVGFASALYTNTLRSGSMAGAGVMGLIASVSNYKSVLIASLLCLVIAFISLKLAGISVRQQNTSQ